jgi:hypothetical protein
VAFIPELADIGMMTYRSMSRHTWGDKYVEIARIPTAIDVGRRFPSDGPPPTRDGLMEIIEKHYFGDHKQSMVRLVASEVERDLRPLYGRSVSGP